MVLLGKIVMKTRKALSEDKLIEAIKCKSRIGAEALYDMYANTLYGIIVKIVCNDEIAEDLLQDSLIKIWDSFDNYDAAKGRLFTWMICIARNLTKDTLRSKQYRQRLITETIECQPGMIAQNNYVVFNTDTIGVRPWLDHLKKDQKDILDLIYFKGYTHSEVAEELHIPLGTVKTRCRMAINILRGIYN
jgi:RNA polymerase sigma factor (sigma-70 family)